jgi:hypothetical protein
MRDRWNNGRRLFGAFELGEMLSPLSPPIASWRSEVRMGWFSQISRNALKGRL